MQGFNYGQLDLGTSNTDLTGLTRVPVGTELRFTNPDLYAMIWHTVTACPAPCTGPTSAPSQWAASYSAPVDFDSTVLGVGLGAAGGGSGYFGGVTEYTLTPTDPGIYTFFCRIHPFMRGGFEAV
jgi:plastocyanin